MIRKSETPIVQHALAKLNKIAGMALILGGAVAHPREALASGKDRIKDPAEQTKGIKEAARKVPAGPKAEAKCTSDKVGFKLRNAIGGTLRGK